MEVSLRSLGDVTILDIKGNLALDRNSQVRERVAGCLAAGTRSILINLAEAPEIDSSGIGQLVQALASAKKAGGSLKLLGASPFVRKILSITGLLSVFEIYDDEATALASF